MRRLSRLLLHQAAFLAPIVALLLSLLPLPSLGLAPVVEAAVSTGSAFVNTVPCLNNPDFGVTRYDNTLYNPPAGATATYPALQTLTPGGAPTTRAFLNSVGSVYGMAHDDGAASGVERLYVAAFTKRLVGYGPAGAGGIYAFNRSGTNWTLVGSFQVPGAVGVAHSGAGNAPVDQAAIAGVGMSSLGDAVVSPDGQYLYVVNVGVVTANLGAGRTQRGRVERFRLSGLTAGAMPQYDGGYNVDYSRISTDPNVVNDLTPFALAWHNYPYQNKPLLMVGITDTARRGVVKSGGQEFETVMAGANFQTPPRAYLVMLQVDATSSRWLGKVGGTDLDLGNSAPFTSRHSGGFFEGGLQWSRTQTPYTVRAWNPWRDYLPNIAGRNAQTMYYPQPLLTDIEIVRTAAPTAADPEPRGLLVVGIRDRTGDLSFNGGTVVPPGERSSVAQGDTVTFQWNGSNAYTLVSGEKYDDNTLPAPGAAAGAHIENHEGALARIPGTGTSVTGAGDTLVASTLLGEAHQGLWTWSNATAGGAGSATYLINGASHAATKATNLGDVEVLCSYALVGGVAWNDADYMGDQDGGSAEPPLAGVTLQAYNTATGAAMGPSLTTGANGRYLFAVPPNTSFEIRVTGTPAVPAGTVPYHVTYQNTTGNEQNDSDASVLGAAIPFVRAGDSTSRAGPITAPLRDSDNRNFDIGLTRTQPTGRVGDRVWNDTNGNGIQDAGEPTLTAMSGTVTLRAVSSEPGVATLTTAISGGTYNFTGVVPGTYWLEFPAPPAGYLRTGMDRGADDTRDSDVDASYRTASFVVPPTPDQLQWDYGLIGGGDVWVDKSGPATANAGQQVTYSLAYGNTGPAVATTVQLVDPLPLNLAFVSSSPAPSAVTTLADGRTQLTWSLGSLGMTATGVPAGRITVVAQVSAPFSPSTAVLLSRSNCATISTTSPDQNAANNTDCQPTDLRRPELRVSKTSPARALIGEEFQYSLAYFNDGSAQADNVVVRDPLPTGIEFVRWMTNPGNACSISGGVVNCPLGTLAAGANDSIAFIVRSNVATMPGSTTSQNVANTATIVPSSGAWPGDDPGNNSSTTTTAIDFPDPTVSIFINPTPTSSDTEKLPVGEDATFDVTYGNPGNGIARSSRFVLTYDLGAIPGTLPSIPGAGACTLNATLRQISCPLGDLPALTPTIRTVKIPFHLPATPRDSSTFAGDSYGVSVTISTTTPERPSHAAGNTQTDTTQVIRPNPRIPSVVGPAAHEVVRMSWGSAYYVTINYENRYVARPHLTRAAANSVLVVRIPDETELLDATPAGFQVDPGDARKLTWQLGTLNPLQAGSVRVALRTDVPVNAPPLHLEADISTTTYGDNLSDNHGENDVTVVAPPEDYPALSSALELAIHSDLDPNHGGLSQDDGVYYAQQNLIAWPAGEVLDFSPRLTSFELDPPPFPLEYRARILRWRIVSFEANGREYGATAADSKGRMGCRLPSGPFIDRAGKLTCAYPYPGAVGTVIGKPIDAFLPARTLLEAQMATQGHAYWTQPPPPRMRPDVYVYTLDPMEAVYLTVAVDVEIWTMNSCPDILIEPFVCGTPIEEPQPPREVRPIEQTYTVRLLVPRSVVGPGGVGTVPAPESPEAPEHP